jgi:hypothetical protein
LIRAGFRQRLAPAATWWQSGKVHPRKAAPAMADDPVCTPAATGWRRRTGWTSPWAAGLVLVLFYATLQLSLREKSATYDEPGHATAGYVYWKYGDFRLDPENGNLSKRWIALPYVFSAYRFPADTTGGWFESNTWRFADAWFNRMGNDTTGMLARGRAMAGLVAVALAALVWWWSRRLFGPAGGMVSLLVCALSPIILANGGLMTSDTPAALGFLAALGAIWALLQRITVVRLLAALAAISGLFLAKMSAVLLLPMAAVLVAARLADGRPLPVGATRVLGRRPQQAAAIAGVALLQTLGVVALVWAAYGFRYSAFSPTAPAPHRFHRPWQWALGAAPPQAALAGWQARPPARAAIDEILAREGGAAADWTHRLLEELADVRSRLLTPAEAAELDRLSQPAPTAWIPRVIASAREHRWLPEAFLFGYAHVWRTAGRLAAFLNGEIRETGWPGFFPYTFAVKTPLAFLAILALAVMGAAAALRRAVTAAGVGAGGRAAWQVVYPVLPLLVLLGVYGAVAISSALNIGHRHLLPIYPPLFILAGAAAAGWVGRRDEPALAGRTGRCVATAALATILAMEMAWWFPNYIAYFNGLVAPRHAYRHLVDSSLDWGQELPAIARYTREHGNEPAYLAVFGVGSPAYYGIKARDIGGFPALDWILYPPLKPVFGTPDEQVAALLRQHPEYDPALIFRVGGGEQQSGVLLLMRASEMRLGAGHYIISASMLQPLYQGNVNGYWNPALEARYQELRQTVAPFLGEDRAAKLAAMPTRPLYDWMTLMEDFFKFRLGRLTAQLRQREPDEEINYAVLVYRLSEDEVHRALDGPPPLEARRR